LARRLVEYAMQHFAGAQRFVDEWPRELLAKDVELTQRVTPGLAAPGPVAPPEGVDGG
jgi:hypothetical protein